MDYKPSWTEFEVQALAYSILRKALYPGYLVRGEYKFDSCRPDISVWKANQKEPPELKFVIEIKKNPSGEATAQGERYTQLLNVPCIYLRGKEDAYKVLSKVSSYL